MSIALASLASMGGGTLRAYGNYISSIQQSRAMERESLIKDVTAQEIRYRSEINQLAIKQTGRQVKGEQLAELSSSGRAVGTATSYAILEQTTRDIANEVINEKRTSDFEAAIAELEARNLRDQARKTRKAALIGLAGDLLSTGGQFKSSAPGSAGGS